MQASEDSISQPAQQLALIDEGRSNTTSSAASVKRNSTILSRGNRRCACRCGTAVTHCLAKQHDIRAVLDAMRLGEPVLARDVLVGGILVPKNSILLQAGEVCLRSKGEPSWQDIQHIQQHMQECIVKGSRVYLSFSALRAPFPWCVLLACPCRWVCFIVLVILAFTVFGVTSLSGGGPKDGSFAVAIALSTDLSSMTESDGNASMKLAAFQQRVQSNREGGGRRLSASRNSVEELFATTQKDATRGHSRSLQGQTLYAQVVLELYYHPLSDNVNLLSIEALQAQLEFELDIKQLPGYKHLCGLSHDAMKPLCDPGFSVANLVFPRGIVGTSSLAYAFDGTGYGCAPFELALWKAKRDDILQWVAPSSSLATTRFEHYDTCIDHPSVSYKCDDWKRDKYCSTASKYWNYMRQFCAATCGFCTAGQADDVSNPPPVRLPALRTILAFKKFCCYSTDPKRAAKRASIDDEFNAFVEQVVKRGHDFNKLRTDFNVLVSGSAARDIYALETLYADLTWSAVALAFVELYTAYHCRSLFLGALGLMLVSLSIPSSVAIYKLVSLWAGATSSDLNLLSCLAVFLVIGVGSDMIFLYTDSWLQSTLASRDLSRRIKFTYVQAGSTTLATTFTTYMSFISNIFSSLRSLREFGFFMATCIMMAWVLMLLGYPPLLIASERLNAWIGYIVEKYVYNWLYATVDLDDDEDHDAVDELAVGSVVSIHYCKRYSMSVARGLLASCFSLVNVIDTGKDTAQVVDSTSGSKCWGFVATQLRRFKFSLLFFFVATTVILILLTQTYFAVDFSMPAMYPPKHPITVTNNLVPTFKPWLVDGWPLYDPSSQLCHPMSSGSCLAYGCTTDGPIEGNASSCECFSQLSSFNLCEQFKVSIFLFGLPSLTEAAYKRDSHLAYLSNRYPGKRIEMINTSRSPNMFFGYHWESGRHWVGSLIRLDATIYNEAFGHSWNPDLVCFSNESCHCGVEACHDSMRFPRVGVFGLNPDVAARSLYGEAFADGFSGSTAHLSQRADSHERRMYSLAMPTGLKTGVRSERQAKLAFVFGLEVVPSRLRFGVSTIPKTTFLTTFDFTDPSAQRAVRNLCEAWPVQLNVVAQVCWIQVFVQWWKDQQPLEAQQKGTYFPLRVTDDINSKAYQFATRTRINQKAATDYVWFDILPGTTRVAAMYLDLWLGIDQANLPLGKALMSAWNDFESAFNDDASDSYKGAWHCSRLWESVEANVQIIGSTVDTLLVSFLSVFGGVLVFTRSLMLAGLVSIVVVTIFIMLAMFIIVIMGWKVGAVEVMCLIIFIGVAVDYSLHIAHKYGHCKVFVVQVEEEDEEDAVDAVDVTAARRPSVNFSVRDSADNFEKDDVHEAHELDLSTQPRSAERFERSKYALGTMGTSIVGSAATTLGCACFLFPCQIVVFFKVGAVVCAVTLAALLYTLILLPTLLITVGPCARDSEVQLIKRCCNAMWRVIRCGDPETEDGEQRPQQHFILNMPMRSMGDKAVVPAAKPSVIGALG